MSPGSTTTSPSWSAKVWGNAVSPAASASADPNCSGCSTKSMESEGGAWSARAFVTHSPRSPTTTTTFATGSCGESVDDVQDHRTATEPVERLAGAQSASSRPRWMPAPRRRADACPCFVVCTQSSGCTRTSHDQGRPSPGQTPAHLGRPAHLGGRTPGARGSGSGCETPSVVGHVFATTPSTAVARCTASTTSANREPGNANVISSGRMPVRARLSAHPTLATASRRSLARATMWHWGFPSMRRPGMRRTAPSAAVR